MLMSDNVDYNRKLPDRQTPPTHSRKLLDIKWHYIVRKGLIHQEDVMILNE